MGKAALIFLFLAFPVIGSAEEMLPHLIESVDVYGPRNVNNGLSDDTRAAARNLLGAGYSTVDSAVRPQSAIGGRLGILFQLPQSHIMFGPSLSYIAGPNSRAVYSGRGGPSGNGSIEISRNLQYLRAMGEIRWHQPVNSIWSFNVGSAAGVATGFERTTCTGSGSLAGSCPFDSASHSWTGVSWQFSSSVAYSINATDLALGVRYVHFPSFPGAASSPRIDWTTLGMFFEIDFKTYADTKPARSDADPAIRSLPRDPRETH
jgi:hypothetical protein